MAKLNCHFVSRFLTRPWEFGKRRLWYFDFDNQKVGYRPSSSLFATKGANTPGVEQRLNQVIETPIAQEMGRLLGAAPDARDLEWPLVRAVALLMMLQPLRPGHPERIEQTVMRTDAELDGLARAAAEMYHLGRIGVRTDAALLYPEAGYFALPAERDDGQWEAGVAVPAGLHHVFVAVRRTLVWETATTMWARNGSAMIANASVGASSRVVLPPSHKQATSDEEIGTKLREMRQMSRNLIDLCGQMNDALAGLNEA